MVAALLRPSPAPAPGGGPPRRPTAGGIDFAEVIGPRLPWFMGSVLALSFVLLLGVFRSVLVPLKAVPMNLLSIGAAYGVLVMVFRGAGPAGCSGSAGAPPSSRGRR